MECLHVILHRSHYKSMRIQLYYYNIVIETCLK